jgi:hypothetical protein
MKTVLPLLPLLLAAFISGCDQGSRSFGAGSFGGEGDSGAKRPKDLTHANPAAGIEARGAPDGADPAPCQHAADDRDSGGNGDCFAGSDATSGTTCIGWRRAIAYCDGLVGSWRRKRRLRDLP